MTINRSEIAEALAKAEKAVKNLRAAERKLARFPAEPPIGAVLVFEKTFTDRSRNSGPFTYAAVRVQNGKWYFSGFETHPRTWDSVVEFIGDSPCRIASAWVTIPGLPEEEAAKVPSVEDVARLYGVSVEAFADTTPQVDTARRFTAEEIAHLLTHNHIARDPQAMDPGPYPFVTDASVFISRPLASGDIRTAGHARDFEDGTIHHHTDLRRTDFTGGDTPTHSV